jgi:hypothetical protein
MENNTGSRQAPWVINRAKTFVGIARKGFMPHATVFDPKSSGDVKRDAWTPEAEKFARLMRGSEEMYNALKLIEANLTQIHRGCAETKRSELVQEALSAAVVAIFSAENDREIIDMYSYQELEKLYHEGKATMPVDHANHREIVKDGWRYFCMWSSKQSDMDWHVYKVEMDR